MAKKKQKSTKPEQVSTPQSERPTYFTWRDGTRLEKISFIAAVATLVVSVIFLVFEFIYEYEEWPYICFDFSIALTFAFDAITNLRHHRGFAILSFVFAALFLAYAIFKLITLA